MGRSKAFKVTIIDPADAKKQLDEKRRAEKEQKAHEKRQDQDLKQQEIDRRHKQQEQNRPGNNDPTQAAEKQKRDAEEQKQDADKLKRLTEQVENDRKDLTRMAKAASGEFDVNPEGRAVVFRPRPNGEVLKPTRAVDAYATCPDAADRHGYLGCFVAAESALRPVLNEFGGRVGLRLAIRGLDRSVCLRTAFRAGRNWGHSSDECSAGTRNQKLAAI